MTNRHEYKICLRDSFKQSHGVIRIKFSPVQWRKLLKMRKGDNIGMMVGVKKTEE